MGKNADKRAARRATPVAPLTDAEVAAMLFTRHPDPDEPIHLMLDAARGVDGELYRGDVPVRCQNCGQWCFVMAYQGDRVCSGFCSQRVEERRQQREAKS